MNAESQFTTSTIPTQSTPSTNPMYRDTDTFEQKVAMAERRLQDEICEEHRQMAILTKGMSQGRFPQSGAIAYEMHLHRKEGKAAVKAAPAPQPAIVEEAPVVTNRYGLSAEFNAGDIVSYTSILGKTSIGEIISVFRNYDPSNHAAVKYEVRLGSNHHTNVYYPNELKSAYGPVQTDAYAVMEAAKVEYLKYASLDTFDLAADHATYMRKVAAHKAFLRAQAAYVGTPKCNEAIIEYLYGKEAVTPATPTPAPVSAEAETPRTGRVSCYDAKNDYGYIVSKGQSFYFQKRHLKHSNMPIKGGDTVTFSVWESRTGMPKATGIVVEGYIAPVNPAVERAQAEARKTAEREARRKAILEAGRANRQSALKAQGA